MKNYLKKFLKQEDGAELVEYAIVVAIVAVLAAAVLIIVGKVKGKIEAAGQQIEEINPEQYSPEAKG